MYFPTVNDSASPLGCAVAAKMRLSYEKIVRSAARLSIPGGFVGLNLQNDWNYLRGLARQTPTSPAGVATAETTLCGPPW
jgi:AICAR transformylase/IMP cyclohydrolase PurH